jgi:hypothetical protein
MLTLYSRHHKDSNRTHTQTTRTHVREEVVISISMLLTNMKSTQMNNRLIYTLKRPNVSLKHIITAP